MTTQTNSPKVDDSFMEEDISQGFPKKSDTTIEIELRSIIKEDKPAIVIPKMNETTKRKRSEQTDYRKICFERVDFTNRQTLWLTRETHLILLKIVNVIGGHKANLSCYVENIIRQHFKIIKRKSIISMNSNSKNQYRKDKHIANKQNIIVPSNNKRRHVKTD